MFDLFRSREKAVRILLGALLVLVGLSMLTYLVPNYNTGSSSSDDTVVATVNKEPITQLEVQRILQNTLRGGQIPATILPNYVPQLVNNLVTERALEYEAQRLGFQVTDAQISDAIRQYLPQMFQDGKFVGKDAYAQFLAQQNLTIPEFENDMRRQLLVTRMREVAVQGVVVTPQEIEQEYRRKNEKVKIEYVKLSSDKYKAEVQPTTDEMQQYFKYNQSKYTEPERRNLTLLIADQTKLEQTVNPTDADMQRVYTQEQAQFRVPEQVKVRHILLKTQGKPPSEERRHQGQGGRHSEAGESRRQLRRPGEEIFRRHRFGSQRRRVHRPAQRPDGAGIRERRLHPQARRERGGQNHLRLPHRAGDAA